MNKSNISWTEYTWNPTTGCNKVSQGCKNCYAEKMHKRLMIMKPAKYNKPFLEGAIAHEDALDAPIKLKKPRLIFVNSMSDLFHENISFEFIDQVFEVMLYKAPWHTYQVLTKRPERMLEFAIWKQVKFKREFPKKKFTNDIPYIFPANIWVGTSVENQDVDDRIYYLLHVPAKVRFLSCEPLLGFLNLDIPFTDTIGNKKRWYEGIHQVIVGGESGHMARAMHPDWARSLRDQCKAAGVPFFFKQWGEYAPVDEKEFGVAVYSKGILNNDADNNIAVMKKIGTKKNGRLLDGQLHDGMPEISELAELDK